MDSFLYFIRDKLDGTHYFIYAFVCLLFLFAIIGYLFKQKYAKIEFKLATSQPSVAQVDKKTLKKPDKEKKKKIKKQGKTKASSSATEKANSQVAVNPGVVQQPQAVASNFQPMPVNLAPNGQQAPAQVAPQMVNQGVPQGGLQQPTSLPNLNQTPGTQQTPANNQGIPEIIK